MKPESIILVGKLLESEEGCVRYRRSLVQILKTRAETEMRPVFIDALNAGADVAAKLGVPYGIQFYGIVDSVVEEVNQMFMGGPA